MEAPNGKLYVGTWNNGLLELEYDEDLGNYVLVKEHNYETLMETYKQYRAILVMAAMVG